MPVYRQPWSGRGSRRGRTTEGEGERVTETRVQDTAGKVEHWLLEIAFDASIDILFAYIGHGI